MEGTPETSSEYSISSGDAPRSTLCERSPLRFGARHKARTDIGEIGPEREGCRHADRSYPGGKDRNPQFAAKPGHITRGDRLPHDLLQPQPQ